MKRRSDQKPQVTTPDASRVVPWIFDQLLWMHPGYFGLMNNYPGYIQGSTLDVSRVTGQKSPRVVLWIFDQLPRMHPGQYPGFSYTYPGSNSTRDDFITDRHESHDICDIFKLIIILAGITKLTLAGQINLYKNFLPFFVIKVVQKLYRQIGNISIYK